MDLQQSFALVKEQYSQLPWLHQNTILLSAHGSHAYGTNIETSDWDMRGVCIPPKEYYFSPMKNFEQADKFVGVDCSIFGLKKFVQLASNNNPNVLEILYTHPSEHVIKTSIGQKLINNRDMFLSKKARWTFSGYAIAQLKRIKGHKHYLDNPPDHQPTRDEFGLPQNGLLDREQLEAAEACIKKKLDSWNPDFSTLEDADRINIENKISEVLIEITGASIYLEKEKLWQQAAVACEISPNFIQAIMKERAYKTALREYNNYLEWQKNRNEHRASLEAKFGYDCKHAMHLVRLLRMCKELLLTGEVIVKRPDAKELLDIRNGKWPYEKIIEYAECMDEEMNEWYNKSSLPREPRINEINNLIMELTEEFFAATGR